jgi:hypothetical protein
MPIDGRSLKRRHLIYYLEVFNEDNDSLLGHLVDLSTQGMKIVSKNPLEKNQNFNLKMRLPEGEILTGEKYIHFQATCKWNDNAVNPDFFDIGFQITGELDSKARDIISSLINRLGFND